MSQILKTVYTALVGAWGALISWTLLDVILRLHPTNVFLDDILAGLIIGVCIGGAIGGIDRFLSLRQGQVLKGLWIGSAAGAVAGFIGLPTGELFFRILGASIVSRATGWIIFGIGVGASVGLLSLSKVDKKKALHGSIGGALGGLIGGCVFHLLTRAPEFPKTSRAISLVILGACIGLFIGLVQIVMAQAIVKIVKGRPEGREEIITKPVTTLGRSEVSDIGLFGDADIEKEHAIIKRENHEYILSDTSEESGIYVNKEKVKVHTLKDGDMIGIGGMLLLFKLKEQRRGE